VFPVRVLIADDDAIQEKLLTTILGVGGYEVVIAHDGLQAWEIAQRPDSPSILLLDWLMPGLEGVDVCRRVRQRGSQAYVILVTSRAKQRDVLEGLEAGADDFIAKPYPPNELLARVRVGERALGARQPRANAVLSVLREASRGGGGEVVVREGEVVGRIFFFEGLVVWAHVSSDPGSLLAQLNQEPSISRQEMQLVIEECQRTGRNFGEVLIEWGLVGRAALREQLQRWMRRKIQILLALQDPEVLFVPQTRRFVGELAFSLDELLPPELDSHAGPRLSVVPRPLAIASRMAHAGEMPPWCTSFLHQVMALEGVLGACVSTLETGSIVGRAGLDLDPDSTWAQIKIFNSTGEHEAIDDLLVSSATRYHLARLLANHAGFLLHVVVDRSQSTLAFLRMRLAELASAPG
jgi:CheY-like chemotaxis protein